MIVACRNVNCPYHINEASCGHPGGVVFINKGGMCSVVWTPRGEVKQYDRGATYEMLKAREEVKIIDAADADLRPVSSEVSDVLQEGLPHEQEVEKKGNDEDGKEEIQKSN